MANKFHGIDNPTYEDTDNDEINCEDLRNVSFKKTIREDNNGMVLEKYIVHENGVDGLRYDMKTDSNNEENASEIPLKFFGPVFRRVKKKSVKKWRIRSLEQEEDILPNSSAELGTSKYSLMSGELTAEAVKLWFDLPEEVKYDPALALFRQFHEKENGKLDDINLITKVQKTQHLALSNQIKTSTNVQTITNEATDDVAIVEIDEMDQDKTLDTRSDSTKIMKVGNFIKMCLLLSCWFFFTIVFMMYSETENKTRLSSIRPGEVKNYGLNDLEEGMNIVLYLTGPFLSEPGEKGINTSDTGSWKCIEVWIEISNANRRTSNGSKQSKPLSRPWRIVLQDDRIDFSEGELRTAMFSLPSLDSVSNKSNTYAVCIRTTSNETVPFTINYNLSRIDDTTGVIFAFILLCGLYTLIIFEVINRTIAAILTSTASLAALALAGERPSLVEVVSWLDEETLLLLFSMMLLVSIMAETRIFDFIAVFTFEVTKGKIWPLVMLLCFITAALSTVLDNVTTVLLMTPVNIRLCELMDMDPIPVLMSMVIYSNIGGTATPIGDPPNVIIASNKAVIDAGINFTSFSMHMSLGVILVSIQTYLQLRFLFRDTSKLRLNEPRDIQDLRHQISIWNRAAASLPHLSRDEQIVRETLEKQIQKLTAQLSLMVKKSHKRGCPEDTFKTTLAEIKKKYKISDKRLLVKATVAVSFVVIVFLFHSVPEFNRLSLGWTALIGAVLLLILADREDLESILHRIEWSTLIFFAALFVLMEALSRLGLIEFIGGLTESLILTVDESARLGVAIILMVWVSGVSSAFMDNIPLTTMMVRVVASLGSNHALNLPIAPLIWALSFGACLGGNGTLIGASANVVCAGVAEQHGYKFTFKQFFKIGFPIMIGHLVVASGYLLICHCVLVWH